MLGRLVGRYHVAVVRGVMTKNVSARYADVLDEVITAFEDLIPAREGISLHQTLAYYPP